MINFDLLDKKHWFVFVSRSSGYHRLSSRAYLHHFVGSFTPQKCVKPL